MYNARYKVIIFGDTTSGKAMFVKKYLTNLYRSDQTMTIGVDFEVKSVSVDGLKLMLSIWDFEGEKRFKFLLPTYVRGAQGGLFLYDITNYSSIRHIDDWLSIIRKELKPEDRFPIIAVGIIPDEECERQVTSEDGINIVKSRNLNGFIECNPKTGENVEKTFEALTRLMLTTYGYHIERDSPKLPSKQPSPPPEPAETQGPKSPESIKEAIIREVKRQFSNQIKPEQRILDFESEEVKSLMKQYEEETTKCALVEGVITKGFINWLKGVKVETLDLEDLLDIVRMSPDKNELFQFIENGIRSKDDVKDALEVLARVMLSYRYEHYKKDLESFLEKIKQWDDYEEDKYPYSDILKLFSGDNEYRERFLTKIGRWRD